MYVFLSVLFDDATFFPSASSRNILDTNISKHFSKQIVDSLLLQDITSNTKGQLEIIVNIHRRLNVARMI